MPKKSALPGWCYLLDELKEDNDEKVGEDKPVEGEANESLC